MQKKYGDSIKQQFAVLVDNIKDPEALAKYLLDKKVLKRKEFNKILEDKRDFKHLNRLLIFQIIRKNDSAYRTFVDGLERFHLKHLFPITPRTHITVFNPGNQNTPDEEIDLSNLNLHSTVDLNAETKSLIKFNYDERPLDVRVKLATNFQETNPDSVYDTKSSKRGQVLIINNVVFDSYKRRNGSELDVKCLESLFKQMYFKVHTYTELSKLEMENVIQEFSHFDDDKISDICIVIIMSHGEERNNELVVVDKSNNGLKTSWIEEQFSNVNCCLFNGKPKIFLYQICRGNRNDYATTGSVDRDSNMVHHDIDDNEDRVQTDSGNMPNYERRLEDMLVGYATQRGHTAHRDEILGSWYIQLICQVFMERAHNSHLLEMLNEVDRKMRRKTTRQFTMQTSSYTSNGFNKLLYFNPGIYLDNAGNIQRFGLDNSLS